MASVPQPWLVQPLDLSTFDQQLDPADPGFTQLVNDTLGDAATPADGFDEIVTEAAGLLDALDQASAEQDAVLDTILVQLEAAQPTSLEGTLQNYVGTFNAGDQILADTGALSPPDLGALPISVSANYGTTTPPAAISVDFATVKLGSAPQIYHIGQAIIQGNAYNGIDQVKGLNGIGDTFIIIANEQDTASGNQRFTWDLQMTPLHVGTFTAEISWVFINSPNGNVPGVTSPVFLLTAKVTVTP